jgi:S1-C subfamily serine protease
VEAQSAPFDIAVLRASNPIANQPTLPMGSAANARVGQEVVAIGTPLGFLQNTVSRGIVSALRDVDGATMIQTDAAINPGNSGGPLLDSAGRLIGMNTAIATPPGVSEGQGFNVGVGFAVPVDTINKVVPSLIRNGAYTPPLMGIKSAADQVAQAIGVDGVVVESVEPGSGAERAGLRSLEYSRAKGYRADVITSVDGHAVAGIQDIREILSERKSGDVVQVEILRDGRKQKLDVTLK